MARVVQFHQIGGPEVLRMEEVEVPPPGKHRYGHNFSTWVNWFGMAFISATWTAVTRIGTGSS